MELPIEPQSYRMSPGDLLELSVGGETDRTWRLAVSAEGMFLVPGSSAIEANGKSLAELREAVRGALAARFPGKPIELHLLQPGAFRVPVTGQVADARTPSVARLRPRVGRDRARRRPARRGEHPSDRRQRGERNERGPWTSSASPCSARLDQNPFLAPGMSIQVPPARDFVLVTGAVRAARGQPDHSRAGIEGSRSCLPCSAFEWREGDTGRLALHAGRRHLVGNRTGRSCSCADRSEGASRSRPSTRFHVAGRRRARGIRPASAGST